MRKRLFASTGGLLVLMLSACGGGGGGGGTAPINSTPTPTPTPTPMPTPTPTPTPTPVPNINYDTPEYQRSNGASAHGAITAYQAGATGQGVKIAVIDTGINPALAEFTGRIDPASSDVAGSRGVGDSDGHGTAVAAVAAAGRNDLGIHGVAFDAAIVSLRADQPGSCESEDGCAFYDNALAAGVDAARLAGARVINMSLGGSSPSNSLLNAMQRAVNSGIVIVISAGNDGEKPEGGNPDPLALVPAQYFPGNVIIAGSVGVSNGAGGTNLDQISTFSNRAGTGADYYLTALGYRDLAPDQDGTMYYWSGTSFSAPVITGAVALLAQAFPNLTAGQIISILYDTADDLGEVGVDKVYGRGRLNINRAFQPIGTTKLAGTSMETGSGTSGTLPESAGDSDDPDGKLGVIILDGYSRAFSMNLAAGLRRAEPRKPLHGALAGGTVRNSAVAAGPVAVALTVADRSAGQGLIDISQLGIGPEDAARAKLIAGSAIARLDDRTAAAFGFAQGAKAMERRLSGADAGAFLIARDIGGDPGFAARRGTSMALRRNLGPVNMTASYENGSVWQELETSATGSPYRWTSVALDRDFGKTFLSAGVSRLDEKRTLLGGRVGEAFGGAGGSTSLFFDLEARRDLGSNLSATLRARRGWTSFDGGSFTTAAYAVDVQKLGVLGPNDRLGLRVSQPLRIEKGGFGLMLPTGYSYETLTAENSWSSFSLTPSGRELDTELSYSRPVAGGWLGGNLYARRQPGHIKSAPADVGGAIRFTLGF